MSRSEARSPTSAALQLGTCIIDPSLNEIRHGDACIHVKPKSMAVLLRLAEAPGEVLSRETLFASVWGDAQLTDEVLTQAVAELRRALHDPARGARLIQTVSRRGYRLLQPLRAFDKGVPREPAQTPPIRALEPGVPRPSVLAGRHRELAVFVKLLEDAGAGRGGLVLLSGEPGIGKTRLAEEVIHRAGDGSFQALSGRCSQFADASLYLPFAEIIEEATRRVPAMTLKAMLGDTAPDLARAFPELHRVYPDLPPPIVLPPEQQRRYFFNSFLQFIGNASRIQPLCLFLDDLQWGDEPSLALLQHLAPHLGAMQVLVIAAFRNAEPAQSKAFTGLLEMLISQRLARHISLERLAPQEVGDMLASLSGTRPPQAWIAAIHDRTEGNPFFVDELFHHLRDHGKALDRTGAWRETADVADVELPESVRWVLRERLARQTELTRHLLSVAALVGRSFPTSLLRQVAGSRASTVTEALGDAERARLIVPSMDLEYEKRELVYAFNHDLIRQTLIAELPEMLRRELHLRIGLAMDELYRDDVEQRAGEVAHHLMEAGDAAEAALCKRYLQLAAVRALELGAGEDALRYTDSALELVTPEQEPLRGQLLFLRGSALRSLARWGEAVSAWQQAIAECRQSGDGKTLADACKETAVLLSWAGEIQGSIAACEAGLAVGPGLPSAARFELLCLKATDELLARQPEIARATLNDAAAISEIAREPLLIGLGEMYAGLHQTLAGRANEQTVEHFETSTRLLKEARDLWNLALATSGLQQCRAAVGQWDILNAATEDALALAGRIGHVGALEWAVRARALSQIAQTGQVVELERTARTQYELAASLNLQALLHGNALILAHTGLLLGRAGDARAWCDVASKAEPAYWRGTAWALKLKILSWDADATLLSELDAYRELLPRAGAVNTWSAWKLLSDLTEGLAMLGRLEMLEDQYAILAHELEISHAVFLPAFPTLLHKTAGILAVAAGEWQHAERHFEIALEQAGRLPHLLESPEVLSWYGWMLARRDRQGDSTRAEQMLARADEEYRALGLLAHAERTRVIRWTA